MKYNGLKMIVGILLLLLAFPLVVNIASALETGDYLDELIFMELQISAVTTDMYMYLGWFPDKKEWIKEASARAINDLTEIRTRISGLNLPTELVELKDMNFKMIDKLNEIYTGIESKKDESIKQEFVSFRELHSQYLKIFKDALNKYRYIQELPQDFDPINEELKLIQEQKDKDAYLGAIRLMNEKEYREAYEELIRLQEKYKDTAFADCIMLRISDCMLKSDADLDSNNKLGMYEQGIEILSSTIDRNRYSPLLYEAFYKWRTMQQSFYHGMSNTSEIPNKEYNHKRWQVVQLIKKQLKHNPDDIWAKKQVDLLLSLPNIARGGPMGNLNLNHWGTLYVDLDKFKSEEKK